MPTIFARLQYGEQMGYNSTGANYTSEGTNYAMRTDRVLIMRWNHIAVPKGSTINNAFLHFAWSVKNDGPQSMSLVPWIDTNMGSLNPWLDQTKNEWTSSSRNWTSFQPATTFNWSVGGAPRQMGALNVKDNLISAMSNTNWTLAGGSASFLISCFAITNADYQYVHNWQDGWGPLIEIDYTPPVSDGKVSVVNVQENQNFERIINSNGSTSIAPWGFNSWFSIFAQPNYSVVNSVAGVPAPPGGGKILEVSPTTGRPMVHNGVPALDEGEWYNFSGYVYIPNTAPAGMFVDITALGYRNGEVNNLPHGQWNRLDHAVISSSGSIWFTFEGGGEGFTWSSACKFYVANAQLTKGRHVRPYIHGAKVLANADHGWAGSNTAAFVRAVPPTVVPVAEPNKGRRKYWTADWNYFSAQGHAQVSSNVKVKKAAP